MWIKASGWGLEEIAPERVHLVSPAGDVLDGTSARHSEYPIHTEIMAARPDVGGVVHTHSPYAVALAAAGQPLRPVSHAANLFVPPDVPRFTETADLILTPELGKQVAATLASAKALFLVNHDTWPTWSDPGESLAKRDHVFHDRALDQVWDYLVRTAP